MTTRFGPIGLVLSNLKTLSSQKGWNEQGILDKQLLCSFDQFGVVGGTVAVSAAAQTFGWSLSRAACH